MHPLVALLRRPLTLIPPEARIRVLYGPLRGARWIVGSGNHMCWLGLYEYRKQVAFQRIVAPGSVVYDIGAHVGFYSLLGSRLVGRSGRVVAFEPLSRNLRYLHEHLRLNQVANVHVIEAAVADRCGIEPFAEHPEHPSYMSRLDAAGTLRVSTVAVDPLIEADTIPPPACLKIDIEGGEVRALRGMRSTLAAYHPTIFLATHGLDVRRDCLDLLAALGYRVRPLNGQEVSTADEFVAEHPTLPRMASR